MFHPQALGLCISLLAEVFPVGPGSRVDLATGARAEVNVGRIPVTSMADSEQGTEEIVVLRSGIRLISPTSTLSLSYLPRYYLRLPDALGIGRPLLLHDSVLAWSSRPSRRLGLSWRVRGSAGELPNSGLNVVFEPGTGRVSASVVPIIQLNSVMAINATTGKRHQTNASLNLGHYDSFGESPAIERTNNVQGTVSHTIGLSSRTSVGIAAQVGFIVAEIQEPSATVGGQLLWTQKLRESASLSIATGINQGWVLGGVVSWPLPTLDIGYATKFRASGQSWGLNFRTGTRAFFDVIAAIYRPQVFLAAGVSGQILHKWTVASTLTFSADISGDSLTTGGQPTQFNFDVPISYQIDRNLDVSFGLRLALSAPPFSQWSTGHIQDQVSLFLALDWGTGTEQSQGGWL